jgi:hypothetical protein
MKESFNTVSKRIRAELFSRIDLEKYVCKEDTDTIIQGFNAGYESIIDDYSYCTYRNYCLLYFEIAYYIDDGNYTSSASHAMGLAVCQQQFRDFPPPSFEERFESWRIVGEHVRICEILFNEKVFLKGFAAFANSNLCGRNMGPIIYARQAKAYAISEIKKSLIRLWEEEAQMQKELDMQ